MSSQPEKVLWLGVDAGEQRHQFVLLDEEGREGKRVRCANRASEIAERLTRLVSAHPEYELRVVTESCRGVGAVLYRTALRLGLSVWKVPPVALAAFRASEGQPRKSDPRDAYLLARMGFLGVSSCRVQVQAKTQETLVCRLARLYEQLTHQENALWQRLRSRLLELHPALVDRSSSAPTYRSRRMLKILMAFPGLVGVEKAALEHLESLLVAVPRLQRKAEARFLLELVVGLQIPQEQRTAMTLELEILARQLDRLLEDKARVRKQLEAAVEAHPRSARLLEVPGVGFLTAAVLIGEVLPLARHATEPQVATYSGVTPLCRRSGRSVGRDRMSRGTNKHVLRSLYLSAAAAARTSALDRAYFRKQRERHAGHPVPHIVATLALARQRMKMLYKLLTTAAEYDKEILIRRHLERRDKAA